jgi:hypothetical protein
MNKEISKLITTDSFFSGYAKSFSNDEFIANEIYSEFLLKVCEMNQDKLQQLYDDGQLKYYCARIIKNVVYHPSSIVKKNHFDRKLVYIDDDAYFFEVENKEDEPPQHLNQEAIEILLKDIKWFLAEMAKENELGWYNQQVFELYHEEYKSLRDMSKDTTIPTSSIYNSVKKTKDKINDLFRERYDSIKIDCDSLCNNED